MANRKWFIEHSTTTPDEQGIIIEDFEWFNFKTLSSLRNDDGSAKELSTIKHHVIILTQSCDLIKANTKYVHVCPVYTLADFFLSQGCSSVEDKEAMYDRLTRNSIVSKHLTNTCKIPLIETLKNDYLVIDFSKAMIVPMAYLNSVISNDAVGTFPMLNIPYRESMAQRYGQYFSRVGNPINLDNFNRSKHITT